LSILNATDLAFELRFKGCHRDAPAIVIGKSPWVEEDMRSAERAAPTAIRIGVNDSAKRWHCDYSPWLDVQVAEHLLPGVLHICQDTPTFQKIFAGQDALVSFFTSPPDLPAGWGKFNRHWPRPWGCITYTSMLSIWLAWYMGCRPVFIAGIDGMTREGRWYDDRDVSAEQNEFLTQTMPANREGVFQLTEAMEADDVPVVWYGRNRHA
jgi:hypothetical protein